MKNSPNLNYLFQLSGGDKAFEKEFLSVLITDLHEDAVSYKQHIVEKKYQECAGLVHKIKPKLAILGMEEKHAVFENHEKELKENTSSLEKEFLKIIAMMTEFLNDYKI